MSINWRQFELGILRPTLPAEVEVAVKLVGETIWHESDQLRALGQYPRLDGVDGQTKFYGIFGPGLGISSIEESTWNWMHEKAEDYGDHIDFWRIGAAQYQDLTWDLRLNVLACRFRYKLDKRPLPKLKDGVKARAAYWNLVYQAIDDQPGIDKDEQQYIADALDIPWVK